MGTGIGDEISFAELEARHDAVLIATGVYKTRDLKAPGVGSNNIVQALDYLTASNRKGLGDAVPAFDSGDLDAKDKNIVVIGGGDTAHGLCPDRRPPGGQIGQMPLSPG